LRDFQQICRICTSFQDTLAVKTWMDLLKGYRAYGVLSWRTGFPQMFSAPYRRNYASDPSDPQEFSLSPCQVWWGSDVARRPGGKKRRVFVFVCLLSVGLFVRHAFERYSPVLGRVELCFATDFYSAPQCSHCKRCISYGSSVRLSVRPSVCLSVTVLCQNDGT